MGEHLGFSGAVDVLELDGAVIGSGWAMVRRLRHPNVQGPSDWQGYVEMPASGVSEEAATRLDTMRPFRVRRTRHPDDLDIVVTRLMTAAHDDRIAVLVIEVEAPDESA